MGCGVAAGVIGAFFLWPRPKSAPPELAAKNPAPRAVESIGPPPSRSPGTVPVQAKPTHAEPADANAEPADPNADPVEPVADRRLVLRGREGPPGEPPHFADGSGKEAIRTALREITPGVRDCYEQGLRLDPELHGSLALQLTIDTREGVGRIVEAQIDEAASTMHAVLVQACVLDTLTHAEFPAPRDQGVISFTYPFHFAKR